MNSFLQKLKSSLYRFSYGRYGSDAFSKFLLYSGLGIFLIYAITGIRLLYTLALVTLFYNCFRILSKNHQKRYQENQAFLFYKGNFDSRFALQKRMWNERKTHVFYKCPKCKTVMRLPKGRGKIEIICPKCKNNFIKKT
ncbi:MAG: hypothetical protein E7488_00465 [Ruminococcaceae bacterium]|nr:hypothetical protein [Oscillospiraceae bacterium]